MNNKRLLGVSIFMALFYSSHSISGDVIAATATITVSGTITNPNTCTLGLNTTTLPAGTLDASTLSSAGEQLSIATINATVTCLTDTIVGIKFSSTLSTDSSSSDKFGIIQTGSTDVAYVYVRAVGNVVGGASSVVGTHGGIGDLNFSNVTTSTTIPVIPVNTGYVTSTSGDVNNTVTYRTSGDFPGFYSTYIFPFRMHIDSAPKANGWPAALGSNTIDLANTITMELHIQ